MAPIHHGTHSSCILICEGPASGGCACMPPMHLRGDAPVCRRGFRGGGNLWPYMHTCACMQACRAASTCWRDPWARVTATQATICRLRAAASTPTGAYRKPLYIPYCVRTRHPVLQLLGSCGTSTGLGEMSYSETRRAMRPELCPCPAAPRMAHGTGATAASPAPPGRQRRAPLRCSHSHTSTRASSCSTRWTGAACAHAVWDAAPVQCVH